MIMLFVKFKNHPNLAHCSFCSLVLQVSPGSLAAKCGLLQGDVILKIGNKSSETLKHKDAQDAIIQYGNKLDLLLQR